MCVTDEMVEAGWQSFVRAGVDKRTQNAYVSKTDLRAAIEAALSHAAGQEAQVETIGGILDDDPTG